MQHLQQMLKLVLAAQAAQYQPAAEVGEAVSEVVGEAVDDDVCEEDAV